MRENKGRLLLNGLPPVEGQRPGTAVMSIFQGGGSKRRSHRIGLATTAVLLYAGARVHSSCDSIRGRTTFCSRLSTNSELIFFFSFPTFACSLNALRSSGVCFVATTQEARLLYYTPKRLLSALHPTTLAVQPWIQIQS